MSCRNCDYDLCADCCPPPGNSSWSLSYEVTSTAGSETFTLPVTIGSRVRLTPWVRMSEAGHSITLRGLTSAAPAVADFDAAAAAAAPSASPAVVAPPEDYSPPSLAALLARDVALLDGRCELPATAADRGADGGDGGARGGAALLGARPEYYYSLAAASGRPEEAALLDALADASTCRCAAGGGGDGGADGAAAVETPEGAAGRGGGGGGTLQLCGATERYMATAAAAAGPLWQAQLLRESIHASLVLSAHALAGDLLLGGERVRREDERGVDGLCLLYTSPSPRD